jgi:anti-anti-sigma regulatory factor
MPQHIQLDAEQTIYQASETHSALISALHDADGIELDLSKVQELDTAFVQILLWLQQESVRLSKPLQLLNPSPALCRTIQLLGLDDHFPATFGGLS